MKDPGVISKFLSIELQCGMDCISTSQAKFIQKVLQSFNIQKRKPRKTPCEMNSKESLYNEFLDDHDAKLYRQLVRSKICDTSGTRPYLSYVLTFLSQHMPKPTNDYMVLAKHVLRYLKGTRDQKKIFKIIGSCDAD